MDRVRVGVVDEHEIFRHGLVACLAADPDIEVVFSGGESPGELSAALVVASPAAATGHAFDVPLVVCTDAPLGDQARSLNSVLGVLPRSRLTPAQLINGVRAAASGLRVNMLEAVPDPLSQRNLEILRMLAAGAATRQISDSLGYSERTIKHAVAEILHDLGAGSRAEAVALGIRRGLI